MLVELVIIACLDAKNIDNAVKAATPPGSCEEFRIPYMDQMNIIECVWQSQMMAAEWSGRHPGWTLRRVTCELPKA